MKIIASAFIILSFIAVFLLLSCLRASSKADEHMEELYKSKTDGLPH